MRLSDSTKSNDLRDVCSQFNMPQT